MLAVTWLAVKTFDVCCSARHVQFAHDIFDPVMLIVELRTVVAAFAVQGDSPLRSGLHSRC
jgi:hypothetical protein